MKKEYFSQTSPAAALHRSMFILQQKADQLLSRHAGAGLSQVRIMGQLHFSVPRSQRTVAAMLHQTEANVSRQLRLMKKAGLVNIVRNKRDRRVREVTLTHKGQRIYEKAEKLLNQQHDQLAKLVGRAEAKAFQKAVDLLGRSG